MIDAVVVSKLDEKNNMPLATVDPVDQDGDRHTSKCMRISSIQPCSSLHTLEDDMVFSDEDLITIGESVEQHQLDVGEIDTHPQKFSHFQSIIFSSQSKPVDKDKRITFIKASEILQSDIKQVHLVPKIHLD
ncbi:Uncharacterized protein Fot_24542 [Forsythia ovata]|uniref:Uncharacterized protein n=1 Tax=Forsythia ovata TaxID=205694 RepID=A0ABD1U6H4_9LAMI